MLMFFTRNINDFYILYSKKIKINFFNNKILYVNSTFYLFCCI